MLNGKRSHALFGVLTGVCSYYSSKRKKPSLAVLAATAVAGALAVSIAIGWRNNYRYERDIVGFAKYITEFDPSQVLVSMNMKDREDDDGSPEKSSKETEEYCGFLLMLDTVPEKSEHDFGASYIRLVSTFIPRMIWTDKPYFGRDQWVKAWIAGSEFHRDETFTGPAVSILGAAQLNGGDIGTLLVLGATATLIRAGLRILPQVSAHNLGPALLGDDLLQRLAHGRQRRPIRLVLLCLWLWNYAVNHLNLGLP